MKVLKWLDDHFEETLMVIFLVFISCISFLQIIMRTFFEALTWAEEICRYFWIWSVFISLPYTIRKGSMLRVNVVMDLLPYKLRNAINIAVDIVIVAVMGFLFKYGLDVLFNVMKSGQTSQSLGFTLWNWVYTCIPLGFGLGALRGIQQAILHIMNFNKRELTTQEQAMQDAAEEAALAKGDEGGAKA